MPAVVAGDVVSVFQLHADRHRVGFLPAIEVQESRDFAGGVLAVDVFLELADGTHPAVGFQQFGFGQGHTSSPGVS